MSKSNIISYQTISSSQIYLNSNCADVLKNGSLKSNIEYYINDPVSGLPNTIELRISVVNAQIPCSYYLINSFNNTIKITISGTTTSYSIPSGNYNVDTFITQFITTCGNTWSITYSNLTNKYTFTNSTNDFIFVDSPTNSIFGIIGFNKGSTYTSISKSYTAPYCFNFTGLTRILIGTPTFSLNNRMSYDAGNTTIMCSIPTNSIQNGMIYYSNLTNYKSIFSNSHMSTIELNLQDDSGHLLDLNNCDWSITLQIDMINEVILDLNTVKDIYKTEIENLNI